VLTVSGTMTLADTSACHLYSGVTNGVSTNYGGLVQVVQDIVIATNSRQQHGYSITPGSFEVR